MIGTILQISFRRLLHSRIELMLTFLVPVAFFSIFALIFGGTGNSTTPKVKVVVVDEVNSAVSHRVVDSLRENASLRFMRDEADGDLTRAAAEKLVRAGGATMAIVLAGENTKISPVLLADSSDQVASQVVAAIVTKTMLTQMRPGPPNDASVGPPDGVGQPDGAASGASTLTSAKQPTDRNAEPLTESNAQPIGAASAAPDGLGGLSTVEIVDVMGEGKANPVVSMYAAGIAVMFLLFGASNGGGALLEEYENQTLDRLLSTQMTMDQLLLGKWFYLTLIGFIQVCVMFAWGQAVFGVDLLGHLDGFLMMTIVTASAAAAFGLFLATLCRTRGQLNGLSIVLILTMSALGGSMVPRYVMGEKIRELGMWTFNAWALDGYDKVFWRELPVAELAPQLSVLMISGVAFLLCARVLALRWECD